MSLNAEIKKNKSKVFRRAFIKRRLASTGLFESEWQEISNDVLKWGTITQKIDQEKQGRIRFSSTNIIMVNDDGKYNPSENESSLWSGYASQQRTLVKLEAGFIDQVEGADGIWTNTEYPSSDAAIYTGILQGDINVNTKNEMNFNIKPLTQILRDFPAKNLTGFTASGLTASDFMDLIWDQTDGAAEYIFRPFFGDTLTNWNIQTTTVTYANLDSAGSSDIIDKNVWEIVEKLAESENYLAYVDGGGTFNFIDRDNISSTTTYNFNGVGSTDRTYGTQIKDISFFGFRQSKYYSRVNLRHNAADTTTSYETIEAEFKVAGENSPWNFGHKTFSMQNVWLSATSAAVIAQQIFDNVSSAKKELDFNTSFVPHIAITDRLSISYDSNPIDTESLWDQNKWESGVDGASLNNLTSTAVANTADDRYDGQTFLVPSGGLLVDTIKVQLYERSAATGNIKLELWDTSVGGGGFALPKSQVAASDVRDASSLEAFPTWQDFVFSTPYQLNESVSYAVLWSAYSLTGGTLGARILNGTTTTDLNGRLVASSDTAPSSWGDNSNAHYQLQIIQATNGVEIPESEELVWDANLGNAIYLLNDEYKPLSIKVNLDKLETTIFSREI